MNGKADFVNIWPFDLLVPQIRNRLQIWQKIASCISNTK